MAYFEGFISPVPTSNKHQFQRHAEQFAPLLKELGATRQVESWGEDVPAGKVTDFRRAVQATPEENVVLSWIEYPDRAARDRANERMQSDPRMSELGSAMPFDAKRLIFGGFAPLLDEGMAGSKGGFIDGIVLAVPRANKERYLAMAQQTSAVFRELGALRVVESWGDDVPHGKVTDFYRATEATPDEQVVLSWIVWPDRQTRDAAWKRCMEDPRMKPPEGGAPFDGQRMFWAGFAPVIDV